MTKRFYILCNFLVFAAVFFMSMGYASLTDHLSMDGIADVTAPVYEEVVITNIATFNGTDVSAETHSRILPTNVKTTINGAKGEKIVYQIKVHNFSATHTYAYTGAACDGAFSEVFGKMTVSAAYNENHKELLPNDTEAKVVSGKALAPGEDFTFYAFYELTDDINDEEIWINYLFRPVIYTVKYLNDNELWAEDYVVNNDEPYYVRTGGPESEGRVFVDWVNASAVGVDSFPAGNTNDYTLSAKWDKLYLIIFVDEDGSVIYEEMFSDSSTALSAEGQSIVDAKLRELAKEAAVNEMTVVWSDYDIASATADIIVRPIYTYTGNLQFTPIDVNGDGIIEYYQVDAVSKLNDPTKIPGQFNGLPVKVINKLYLNEDNFDYGAGVKTIEIGEGVTTLNRNALAYTADLSTVKLPSTLEYIGKNAFSRNFGSDKKVLTIEFNGTMAEWQSLVANSHNEWHNGLKTGSVVKCSDGYFELDRGWFELGGYNWKPHSY